MIRYTPQSQLTLEDFETPFSKHLHLDNSFMVFDKAYNLYSQFDKWTKQKIWFVTRMKDNAVYHVTKVLTDNTKKKKARGVVRKQLITVGYKNTDGSTISVKLRRITFIADDGRQYIFPLLSDINKNVGWFRSHPFVNFVVTTL